MASSPRAMLAWALVAALGSAPRAATQVKVLVTSVGYESPGLVAPLVLLSSSAASGVGTWTVGLAGYTLSAERTRSRSPTVSMVWKAEVTPLNSNSSNYVYRNGERDTTVEFRDATVQLHAGLRVRGGEGSRWRMEVRAIGLNESVGGLADASVLARWRAPYIGLGVQTSYSHVVSDDVLAARWDGFKAAASAVGFIGSVPWWKSQLSLGGGRRLGRLSFLGRTWVLLGHNLDVVNRHLVGGCWDLDGSPALYGYHYAEFRVDRAAVLGGGADLRVAGAWELGLRVGYLSSPSRTTYGEAVRLSTAWNGIGIHVGVGLPRASLVHREADAPLVFAGVSAAVL
jgi:hypothetical protein